MGKVTDGLNASLNGKVGKLSFYQMRGVEGTIFRQKGGPSQKKILTDPDLYKVRANVSEFSGRSNLSKRIRKALGSLVALSDYNISGPLNSLMVPIQKMDTEREGVRAVRLSLNPLIVKGFSLNKKKLFDSVVRCPIECVLERETGSVTIRLPALLPGINLFLSEKYPMFSLQFSLGIVPDVYPQVDMINYSAPPPAKENGSPVKGKGGKSHYEKMGKIACDYVTSCSGFDILQEAFTNWYPVVKGTEANVLTLVLNKIPSEPDFTLLLSVGIRYGIMETPEYVRQVPYAGSAKILAVG